MEAGISNYLFTQGVLGVACIALGIVVIYQQRKLDKKEERIQQLQDLRLGDSKEHSKDYREMSKETTTVLQQTSQNMLILGEKIEVGKRR